MASRRSWCTVAVSLAAMAALAAPALADHLALDDPLEADATPAPLTLPAAPDQWQEIDETFAAIDWTPDGP